MQITRRFKKGAVMAALLGTLGMGAMLPLAASADVLIVAPTAPPAPRFERTPPPRAEAVWIKGHWRWTGRDYAWVQGHWRPIDSARRHSQFADGAWAQTPRGWEWREGGWR